MPLRLDQIQLKILAELQENPRISISELSERVGVSKSVVSKALKTMIEDKGVTFSAGLDSQSYDFKMANLGINILDREKRDQVIDILKKCPKVLNIFKVSHRANLLLELIGFNEQSITSTVNCIGELDKVQIEYTDYLGAPLKKTNIPIVQGDNSKTPCGKSCIQCIHYKKSWCAGCYAF